MRRKLPRLLSKAVVSGEFCAQKSFSIVWLMRHSFMRCLFTDQSWRKINSQALRNLAGAGRDAEPSIEANRLPTANEAAALFEQYLSISHFQNPFLLRRDVNDLFERTFGSRPRPQNQSSTDKDHDLFRAFMIIAIGSIQGYRKKSHQHHPIGYYVAAMQHFNPLLLRSGLAPIHDLLLLVRFAVYHHIGISIWELIRVCMRMCIEQNLYRERRAGQSKLIDEQVRRRVFWKCYMMDRYSSMTLNRPFAIGDDEISINLPVDADDAELRAAEGTVPHLEAFIERHGSNTPSEMSIFLLCVRLRQISSRIHLRFADLVRSRPSLTDEHADFIHASGQVQLVLQSLTSELNDWRSSAPSYETVRCLHERKEWFNLLHTREEFHLVRRAVDVAPKRDGMPSRNLLLHCQKFGTDVILIYSDLFRRTLITATRSYFQMMFAAGLSLLYCGRALLVKEPLAAYACGAALSQCHKTLVDMTLELQDAKKYVAIFDALCRHGSSRLQPFPEARVDGENHTATTGIQNTSMMQVERDQEFESGSWGFGQSTNQQTNSLDVSQDRSTTSDLQLARLPLLEEDFQLLDQSLWDWNLLNDDAMWNVGQYAFGDPACSQDIM
ncbi:hypothetical protein ACJ41O_012387 [Fusarium nematophilum]